MSVDMKIGQTVKAPVLARRRAERVAPDLTSESDVSWQDMPLEIPSYFEHKALATRVLGLLLLIFASPVILLLVALVRCTSRGPGVFAQHRVGKGGRDFMMYKIRTMYVDAEKATGPVWCRPKDSRITCCGRLLRFLHLDELPQLVNIVRGEMDLIGPRPERPEFVAQLVEEVPNYGQRLTVLPGVTGLAQINLPPDETTECVRRKLILDLKYISSASWGIDCRILLCTALRMMGIRHGQAVRLMRLEYIVPKSAPDEKEDSPSDAWQETSIEPEKNDLRVVNSKPHTIGLAATNAQRSSTKFESEESMEQDELTIHAVAVERAHPK
jgi:lipopolysaccharide/colanic/teichoic acid biosynthesis glycosyltransferase